MSAKKNKILVPVDFSEQSLIALSQSYNIAKKTNASIILLYVIEEVNPMVKMFYKGLNEEYLKEAVTDNLQKLADSKHEETGIEFIPMVKTGKVYHEIVEIAKENKCIFIIMGTRGAAVTNKFIGRNAFRVVKTAPCPVITIKGKKHRKGCKIIVLPLDLTNETTKKVNLAIAFAKMFNAEIKVVSVLFRHKEAIKYKMLDQMDIVLAEISSNGIECSGDLVKIVKSEDSLSKTIVQYAQKNNADLIMIMTQSENDIKEFFIGSAAQNIIHHSDIPVLSVKPNINYNLKI